MISPKVFASVPFNSYNALTDMAGTMELYVRGLVEQAGLAVPLLPIGSVGGQEWLDAIQQQMNHLGAALGLAVTDVASYDLRDASDFASWTFSVSNLLESFRLAAGVA